MSISRETYKTSWDVHAWAGVIVGLFSTIMFATGAAVVFHGEIETWQDPYAQKPVPEPDYQRWTELALEEFDSRPPRQFTLWLPEGERGLATVGSFSPESGRYLERWIDGSSGKVVTKGEKLGTLLYHVHTLYDVRFVYAYYFAGVLALALLLILVSGLIIQWDNLVDQFQQFRAEARPFVRWNDLHKVISVSTFPFQLFYAYSAVLIVLAPFFVDAVAGPVFGGDRRAAKSATYGRLPLPASTDGEGEPEPYRSVDELVATAREAVPGLEVSKIMFRNWRRRNARLDVEGSVSGDRFSHATVRVDPASDTVERVLPPKEQSWAADMRRWIAEIHSVHFGGPGTKLLFAIISFACAASMLAGMAVWLARRRRRRDALTDRLLEKLTAGVGTGTLVAAGAVFAASRLLPWEMQGRLAAEESTYYLTFFGCVVAAFAVSNPRRYWRLQLTVAGVLFGVAPLLAFRHSDAGLVGLWSSGGAATIPAVLGVDLGLLFVAAVLFGVVAYLARGGDEERRGTG